MGLKVVDEKPKRQKYKPKQLKLKHPKKVKVKRGQEHPKSRRV